MNNTMEIPRIIVVNFLFHLTWEVEYMAEQHTMLMDKLLLWLSLPKLTYFPLENNNNSNGGEKSLNQAKNFGKVSLFWVQAFYVRALELILSLPSYKPLWMYHKDVHLMQRKAD